MAETLNLSIQLRADGSGLVGEVRGSKEELERLAKTQDKTSESSKKMARETGDLSSKLATMGKRVAAAAAVTAGLAAGAMAHAIKAQIDFGDKVNNLSKRIGASTEALSQYRYIAEITGVQFDQLTTAWQRQTRRISEATQGTGEAVGALQELGLSAEYLRGLRPEDQFKVLAEALNGVSNEGDKVRLAMRFWDTEGVQLLQTIEGGAGALEAMERQADALGLTLSAEQAQNFGEINAALKELSASSTGLANTLAVQLGPTIVSVLNLLNVGIPEAVHFAQLAWSTFRHFILEGVQSLARSLSGLYGVLGMLPGTIGEIYRSAQADLWEFVQNLEDLQEAYAITTGPQQRFFVESREGWAEMMAGAQGTTKAVADLGAEMKALDAARGVFDDLFPERAAFTEHLQRIEQLEELQRRALISSEDLAEALAREADRYSALAERSTAAADALQEVGMHSGRVREQLRDTDSAAKDLGLTFSSAFEDALLKGTSVRDMLAGIAEDIARIVVRRNITEPLADAVGGIDFGDLFGDWFGGGGGVVGPEMRFASVLHGGGEVGVDGAARQVPAALFAGARRMHSGGLAGDEVPAILQRGERVIPRGEGGGITVNYAPVIQAIDTRSGLEFLAQHRSTVVGMVNDAYNRQGRRGPVR